MLVLVFKKNGRSHAALKVLAKSAERTPEFVDMHSERGESVLYDGVLFVSLQLKQCLAPTKWGAHAGTFPTNGAPHIACSEANILYAIATTSTTTSVNSNRAFLVGLIWQVAWRQQLWRSTSATYPTSSCSSVSGVAQCKRMLWWAHVSQARIEEAFRKSVFCFCVCADFDGYSYLCPLLCASCAPMHSRTNCCRSRRRVVLAVVHSVLSAALTSYMSVWR